MSAYHALLRSSLQTSAYRPGARAALQAGLAPAAAGKAAVTWNHGGTLVTVPARMTAWTSDRVRPGASLPMISWKPSQASVSVQGHGTFSARRAHPDG